MRDKIIRCALGVLVLAAIAYSQTKSVSTIKLNGNSATFFNGTGAFSGAVTTTGSPSSGNLTKFSGASTITSGDLSGDVTTSGTLLTTIANDAVTFAKMQNVNTDRLLGRDTAGSGNVEEISLNATLEFTGSTSIQRAALTGDVTASAGSNSTTIANDAVTYAKMQNVGANSVLARSSTSSGDVGEVSLSASRLLGRGSTGDVAAISVDSTLNISGTTLSVGSQPYVLVFSLPGKPAASTTYPWFAAERSVTFAANFAGSSCANLTNATASTTMTVKKNGSSIGTVVFGTGGTCTYTTASGASQSISPTGNGGNPDILTFVSPSQDATLSDIMVSLVGTR